MSKQTTTLSELNTAPRASPAPRRHLQRKCACGTHTAAGADCSSCSKKREGEVLRRSPSSRQTHEEEVPPIVHDVLDSPGQPLDAATRSFMGQRFGHDFSRVRVHTDARAAESALSVNALAYTVGRDVVFGAGQYQPATVHGQRLLAHELTHTIQQSAETPTGGRAALRLAEPGHPAEREAEASEANIAEGRTPSTTRAEGVQLARKSPCATVPKATTAGGSGRGVSAWEEGWDWLTGQHPGTRYFGLGDEMTEGLRKHEAVNEARIIARNRLHAACTKNSKATEVSDEAGVSHSLAGLEGAAKYITDYSTLFTFGMTGNLTGTFLGSYHGCWSARMNCCQGTALLHFHIENRSGVTSATHFPVLGYDRPRPTVGDWLTSPVETVEKWGPTLPGGLMHDITSGPMATVTQVFDWEEPVFFAPPIACPGFQSQAREGAAGKASDPAKTKADAKQTKTEAGPKQTMIEGSVASLSWIDESSPAGSHVADAPPGKTVEESFVTGDAGFRFSNYLSAWVESADSIHVANKGVHLNSGLYAAPSFKGIPSRKYHPVRSAVPVKEQGVEGVEFEQLTGARTVSAGILGGAVGATVASEAGVDPKVGRTFGSAAANRLTNFPPIWTRIKMRLYANGKKECELSEQSLFPSVSFYCDLTRIGGSAALEAEQDAWAETGWGSGNPWGAKRPLGGP